MRVRGVSLASSVLRAWAFALTSHHAAVVRSRPAVDEVLGLDEPWAAHLLLGHLETEVPVLLERAPPLVQGVQRDALRVVVVQDGTEREAIWRDAWRA